MPDRLPKSNLNKPSADVQCRADDEEQSIPKDIEAAWTEWSKALKGIDERTLTLLRVAFDAGANAALASCASWMGKKGGQQGGRVRAECLSPERRTEIAKKAAQARWSK